MRSKDAFDRLMRLINLHKVNFIALQEPFLIPNQIEEFRTLLDLIMLSPISTVRFASSPITNNNSPLRSTTSVMHMIFGAPFVYAKIHSSRRMRLWRSLQIVYGVVNGPWAVVKDFNTILNADEKKGGVPYSLSKSLDFISCMDDYGLMDLV
ncbi:hypothetical protein H5410_036914 [Solanum commersonii]|uniref:Endonuclease/exonuclease/phosphatase domain-containing protein n=1 Tax=Solanum commersonii TaxID=4109 RepID=A0A9J5Y6K4_SOLCO|nr:hypothetical protein H5410_036914 [Solanum commersonii]